MFVCVVIIFLYCYCNVYSILHCMYRIVCLYFILLHIVYCILYIVWYYIICIVLLVSVDLQKLGYRCANDPVYVSLHVSLQYVCITISPVCMYYYHSSMYVLQYLYVTLYICITLVCMLPYIYIYIYMYHPSVYVTLYICM